MLTLAFTGDIAFSKYYEDFYDKKFISDEILDFLYSADEVITNVEAPITQKSIDNDRALNHLNDPKSVNILGKLNSRIWNIGNNHIMDCGVAGLKDTIEAAEKISGVIPIGAAVSSEESRSYYTIVGDDIKVGIISITSVFKALTQEDGSTVTLCLNQLDKIKIIVSEVKKKAKWVVLVVHGGEEFADIPLPNIRNQYKTLLLLGGDIIVGHHPHVVQNYEILENDKAIFYSLGNFIFDTDYQRLQKHTATGILLRFQFYEEKWNWEALASKINRHNQSISATVIPSVFTALGKKDYIKLWCFIAHQFVLADRIAKMHRIPKYKDYDHRKWLIEDIKGCKTQRGRYLLFGRVLYPIAKLKKNRIARYMTD